MEFVRQKEHLPDTGATALLSYNDMIKKNNEIVVLFAIAEELPTMSDQMEKIVITKLPIRLGQFLKLANVVQDGFEATTRIQNSEVKVNGKIEIQRGRKLQALDEITFSNKTWFIATTS